MILIEFFVAADGFGCTRRVARVWMHQGIALKSAAAKFEDTLDYSTPIPVVSAVEDVEIRPDQIQQWLDDLPRANPELSATRIVDALLKLHEQRIDESERLTALEVYRLPVASIVEGLQATFETQSIPLSSGAKRSVDLAQSLLTGLATGYMLSAQNLAADKKYKSSSGKKELAIQRSIYYLGQVLLNGYLNYRPAVPGVWSDLYELYGYAEDEALLLESVPMAGVGIVDGSTTIDASFQHTLLVAAGDPVAMQMGECKRLYELLKRVQDKITIGTKLKRADPVGSFVFDLLSDEPPIPLAAKPNVVATPQLRSINCLKAIRELHNTLKAKNNVQFANTSKFIDVSNLELIRRAIRKWAGNPGRRQSVRSPQMLDLPVCSGVSGTHYYAFDERSFSTFEKISNGEIVATDQSVQQEIDEEHDYIDLASVPDSDGWLQHSKASIEDTLDVRESTQDDRLHHMQVARVMDESAGGVRLRLFSGSMVRLLVGEIVSMQYGSGVSWRVGMVRWLNVSARNYVDVGVMFLSPVVEPVAIQRVDARTDEVTLVPSLLFPENKLLGTPESIVVPRGTHHIEQALKIVHASGQVRHVRPVELKERTSSFDQIVISAHPKKGEVPIQTTVR